MPLADGGGRPARRGARAGVRARATASSIATSSRRTCCSPAAPRWSRTSVSPRRCRRRAPRRQTGRRRRAHGERSVDRDAGVHGARAGAGRRGGPARRPVRVGRAGVRAARGPAPVHRTHHRTAAHRGARLRGAAAAERRRARRSEAPRVARHGVSRQVTGCAAQRCGRATGGARDHWRAARLEPAVAACPVHGRRGARGSRGGRRPRARRARMARACHGEQRWRARDHGAAVREPERRLGEHLLQRRHDGGDARRARARAGVSRVVARDDVLVQGEARGSRECRGDERAATRCSREACGV